MSCGEWLCAGCWHFCLKEAEVDICVDSIGALMPRHYLPAVVRAGLRVATLAAKLVVVFARDFGAPFEA